MTEFQAFDRSMNPFNPVSIIARVNRNEEVEVDEWFTAVFNKAMEVSAHSDGVFDVTIGPLINLWGFGFEKSDGITQEKIDSVKQFVGYRKVRIENKRVVKDDPRIQLNFSAIAKGYACDVIAALLEREGVENYLIDIGGDMVAKGKNQKGNCWMSGINKPDDDITGLSNEVENFAIRLCGKHGIATSGDYRNFRIIDGKKYGHTIDPRTGYPAGQPVLSATIVASDGMTADAYATVFMAMGIQEALEAVEKIPGLDYFLIYEDEKTGQRRTTYSNGLKTMLVRLSNK
jgi:thiamine biosynthesis lipoprotein